MKTLRALPLGLAALALASCHDWFPPRADADVAADADADADVDADADGSADADVDADADGSADADVDADADDDADIDDDQECDTDAVCDDGVSCTEDICVAGACEHTPRSDVCDLAGGETCDAEFGCAHVIWVNTSCVESCDGHDDAHGFLTIAEGLGSTIAGAMNVVRVASGLYDEASIEHSDGEKPLAIIGDGPELTQWQSVSNAALKITGTASVRVRGLKMTGLHRAVELDSDVGASCALEQVTITGCTHEGILAKGMASSLTIDRSLIALNPGAGIKLEETADATMRNSFVVLNGIEAFDSGGVWATGPEVVLRATNCTIADNVSIGSGGIVDELGATLDLSNLIVWNNSPFDDTQCTGCGSSPDVLVDIDPIFVTVSSRAAVEDYRIAIGSPAVDAGRTQPEITVDYWGEPRSDGLIDVGADEF